MALTRVTLPMLTTWTDTARAGIDGIVHILGWSPRMLAEEQRAAFAESLSGTQFIYRWLELADLEAPEIEDAITAMVEHDVILDRTLVVFERALRGDDPRVTQAPELEAASPEALNLTRLMFERGATLAAGTDANNPWVVLRLDSGQCRIMEFHPTDLGCTCEPSTNRLERRRMIRTGGGHDECGPPIGMVRSNCQLRPDR